MTIVLLFITCLSFHDVVVAVSVFFTDIRGDINIPGYTTGKSLDYK